MLCEVATWFVNCCCCMYIDQDGSEPSPNSLSAMNLLRLSAIFHNPDYHTTAESIFKNFNEHLRDHPAVLTGMVSSFLFYTSKPKQVSDCCSVCLTSVLCV